MAARTAGPADAHRARIGANAASVELWLATATSGTSPAARLHDATSTSIASTHQLAGDVRQIRRAERAVMRQLATVDRRKEKHDAMVSRWKKAAGRLDAPRWAF
jgi:hypothetical protein